METSTIVYIIIVILALVFLGWIIYLVINSPTSEGFRVDDGSSRPPQTHFQVINNAFRKRQLELDPGFYQEDKIEWRVQDQMVNKLTSERAKEFLSQRANCMPYENVNQCMSVCSNSTYCSGFYIDEPGTCCLQYKPKFEFKRASMLDVPNGELKGTFGKINDIIKQKAISEGKPIFEKVGQDSSTYRSNLNKGSCKSICPLCVGGRCPKDYRCVDVIANGKRCSSNPMDQCVIENNQVYNENDGVTLNNPYKTITDRFLARRGL